MREQLLELVRAYIVSTSGHAAIEATEHDAGNYMHGDAMSHRDNRTGKPISTHAFTGNSRVEQPYDGNNSRDFYFHIDEAGQRALVVHSGGFLSGGATVINAEGELNPLWLS